MCVCVCARMHVMLFCVCGVCVCVCVCVCMVCDHSQPSTGWAIYFPWTEVERSSCGVWCRCYGKLWVLFLFFYFFAVRGKHWNCKSDFLTYQVLFSCAYFFLIVVKNLVSLWLISFLSGHERLVASTEMLAQPFFLDCVSDICESLHDDNHYETVHFHVSYCWSGPHLKLTWLFSYESIPAAQQQCRSSSGDSKIKSGT